MIDKLPEKNIIRLLEQKNTVHKPWLVVTDDYNKYYLKIAQTQRPYDILNEFICHFLLQCWEIPSPKIAILKISDSMISNSPELKANKLYQNFNFGSEEIKGSIDVNNIFGISTQKDFGLFDPPDLFFKIALFDIWVGNDDRKPTNFNLLFADNKFFAIDHAYAFCSLDYSDLDENKFDFSVEDSILTSEFSRVLYKEINKSDNSIINELSKFFIAAIDKCKNNFDDILSVADKKNLLDGNNRQLLNNFLFSESRNKRVFEIFKDLILL